MGTGESIPAIWHGIQTARRGVCSCSRRRWFFVHIVNKSLQSSFGACGRLYASNGESLPFHAQIIANPVLNISSPGVVCAVRSRNDSGVE